MYILFYYKSHKELQTLQLPINTNFAISHIYGTPKYSIHKNTRCKNKPR